jgi:hypothetical protein
MTESQPTIDLASLFDKALQAVAEQRESQDHDDNTERPPRDAASRLSGRLCSAVIHCRSLAFAAGRPPAAIYYLHTLPALKKNQALMGTR